MKGSGTDFPSGCLGGHFTLAPLKTGPLAVCNALKHTQLASTRLWRAGAATLAITIAVQGGIHENLEL